MKKELTIHPIQAGILKVLLFRHKARFAELNQDKISTDQFSFHLRSLTDSGVIFKNEDGDYSLTTAGKEFANRFDVDSEKITLEKQAKIGVLLCCVEEGSDQNRYLVQQRLKQPYFGFYGFATGKVKWGETVFETAMRELKEETGLLGNFNLVGVKHKMDYAENDGLLEDKYFFVFRIDNTNGSLIENFTGGKNIWLTQEEIDKLPNLFDGVAETIQMVLANKLVFSETKYSVKGY